MRKETLQKAELVSQGILAMAAIYSVPQPNSRPVGVSKTGANVFIGEALAGSSDIRYGAALVHALAAFITPFKVLTKKEMDGIENTSKLCTNEKFFQTLDKLHQERKGETFAATLIKAVGAPTSKSIAQNVAVKLYDHWGVISPSQKSIAVAAMAIQLHKTDEDGAVCDLKIISGNFTFTVSDALSLLQQGKNPYPFVQNFDQLYRLVRVFTDKPSIEGLIDFAVSHNLLGKGVNDAAVSGISKRGIEATGSKAAPQYGVGALATPRGSPAPNGYTDVTNGPEGNIVVPKANGNTSVGAVSGSLVGTKAGASGVSSDAVAVYNRWPKDSRKASDKGSEGGSALISGLSGLKGINPYLYSAMIAFLTRFSHARIDSANPAQYIASLIGISLARIVSGKTDEEADKEGIAIAQQVHSYDPANFAKLQINMRALYANFGVSSKADAYQLSNQAFAEGRITESDLVAMQQIYDLVYDDNSFGYISKLLQGKDKGMEVAKLPLNFTNTMDTEDNTELTPPKIFPDIRARNKARYTQQAPVEEPPQEEAQEAPEAQGLGEEAMEQPAPPPEEGAIGG